MPIGQMSMKLRMRKVLAMSAAIAALPACGAGTDQAARGEAIFRDSAGVVIVENSSGSEALAPVWNIDPNPSVRIGVMMGEPAYQFGRIDGLARLSDGRIVVLDGIARELRYFGAGGEHLYTVGKSGEGPGELLPAGFARLFSLAGDTVAVWTVSRLSLFDQEGEFADAVAGSATSPLGLLSGRTIVAFRGETLVPPPGPEGLTRQANHYVKIDLLNPETQDTVTFKVGRHTWGTRTIEIQPGLVVSENGIHVPFTHPPISYIGSGRFAITTGVEREIEVFDGDGQLVRIIRVADEPTPLPRELFRARTNRLLEELEPETRQERASQYASMPAPAVIPAYAPAAVGGMNRMLMNAEGEIWIGRFDPDSDLSFFPNSNPAVWTVFDGEGRVAGTVHMPPRFTPYELTADGVLGVYRDDFDVEYVQHVRVERTPA